MVTQIRKELQNTSRNAFIEGDSDMHEHAILTRELLGKGYGAIVDSTFSDSHIALVFDWLVRVEGSSLLGPIHYAPVLCCVRPSLGRLEKLLLAIHALVLGSIQGRRPTSGYVIHNQRSRPARVSISSNMYTTADETLMAVRGLHGDVKPPPLVLNKHCCICEFRERCKKEAMQEDIVSLLGGMRDKDIRRLNSKGIFTLTQLAQSFRYRRRSRRIKKQDQRHNPALQALAVRRDKTIVLVRPAIPHPPTCVYFDVEGNADGTFVYLAGLLVVEDGAERRHAFWADGPENEHQIIQQMIETLERKEFALLHFGSYERRFLARIRRAA